MSGEAKRIQDYKTIKCENPQIIYNPYLIPLLQTYRCYSIHGRITYLDNDFDFSHIYSKISYKKYDINTQEDIDDSFIVNNETGETFPLYLMVPCRKCNCCKDVAVHEWMTRAHMECSTSCSVPFFVTLTYNDDNLPEDKSVSKDELQKFLKRLRIHYDRKNVQHSIRYAACGEYGAKYGRPHYHLILWNLPNVYSHIEFIRVLEDLWPYGFVQCKPANAGSIGYVMKYVKKESHVPTYLNIHNEVCKCSKPFFLSSRNKSLGLQYLHDNARYLINNPSLSIEVLDPYSGRILKTSLPHYLINKLYPLISQVIPRYVRCAYDDMCIIWKQLYNSGYPLQDFRYHIIRDKFSFLPTYSPTDKIHTHCISDLCRHLNHCIDLLLSYELPSDFIDNYIRTLEYKEIVQKFVSEHSFTLENLHSYSDKCEKSLNISRIKQLNYDVPF